MIIQILWCLAIAAAFYADSNAPWSEKIKVTLLGTAGLFLMLISYELLFYF